MSTAEERLERKNLLLKHRNIYKHKELIKIMNPQEYMTLVIYAEKFRIAHEGIWDQMVNPGRSSGDVRTLEMLEENHRELLFQAKKRNIASFSEASQLMNSILYGMGMIG